MDLDNITSESKFLLDSCFANFKKERIKREKRGEISKNLLTKNEHVALVQLVDYTVVDKAIEIATEGWITKLVNESRTRSFYFVKSSGPRGSEYLCLDGYCNCQYFCKSVALDPANFHCKHSLAVQIAEAKNSGFVERVTDDETMANAVMEADVIM